MGRLRKKFEKIWNSIKEAVYIVKHHRDQIKSLQAQINQLDQIIKDRTDIHVDYYERGRSTIIAIGHYKNRDYIQTFSIDPGEFSYMIDRLRNMERYGKVRSVDAMPSVKAVIMDYLE